MGNWSPGNCWRCDGKHRNKHCGVAPTLGRKKCSGMLLTEETETYLCKRVPLLWLGDEWIFWMKFLLSLQSSTVFVFFHYSKTAVREHLKAHLERFVMMHFRLKMMRRHAVDLFQGVWTDCWIALLALGVSHARLSANALTQSGNANKNNIQSIRKAFTFHTLFCYSRIPNWIQFIFSSKFYTLPPRIT